jgi:succinate dehydrogenase/fumarate reductase flavoprotein subunit
MLLRSLLTRSGWGRMLMEVDVAVIGSGAAGLTAAVVAARSGMKVVVVEGTALFGGTSAVSGGGVWVPVNHHMKAAGIDDSFEAVEAYLKAVLGNLYDQVKIESYLKNVNEMLLFMEQNTAVRLTPSPLPDYVLDAPGWRSGRMMFTVDFDGNKLGKDFDSIRPPMPEMGLFGSMQVSPWDVQCMSHWSASFQNMTYTVERLGTYFLDRLRGRRGRRMTNGNALVGSLFKSARDAGVMLLNSASAKRLVTDNGRVVGVNVKRNGGSLEIRTRKGVVLATGGFGANEEMRKKLMPQSAHGWSLQPEGCNGEGIAMGQEAGGVFRTDNVANGIWVPASTFRRADGSIAKYPSLFFDRHCPGSILIDARTGRRFVDESFHYHHFGQTAFEKGVTKVWMISDADAVSKYGIGMSKPAPFSPKPWVKKGYLLSANSIAELASKIKVAVDVLERTIGDFNRHADVGEDPEFGRGGNGYDVFMGDPTHTPNPALGALRAKPFYALELRPSDLGSVAGLETSARAEVLDAHGRPIPGLYAAGIDANSMLRGVYPGGGLTLGPAMTFGFIAARELAAVDPSAKRQHAFQ